jgi:hypothetical protein
MWIILAVQLLGCIRTCPFIPNSRPVRITRTGQTTQMKASDDNLAGQGVRGTP